MDNLTMHDEEMAGEKIDLRNEQSFRSRGKPNNGNYCCNCGERFKSHKALLKHLHSDNSEKPYKCCFCNKEFSKFKYLTKHLQFHISTINAIQYSQSFKVNSNPGLKPTDESNCCPVSKTNLSSLIFPKDLVTYTKVTPGNRNISDKMNEYSDKMEMVSKTYINTGQGLYACNICLVSFVLSRNLKRHMSTNHTDVKVFVCNICSNACDRLTTLKDHMCVFHSKDKLYKCGVCGKKFSTYMYLEAHCITHDVTDQYISKRKFKCDICDSPFEFSYDLKDHVLQKHDKSYEDVHRFKCGLCDMAFKKPSQLSKHMKTHYGVPYAGDENKQDDQNCFQSNEVCELDKSEENAAIMQCEVCGTEFSELQEMFLHLVHHAEKNLD